MDIKKENFIQEVVLLSSNIYQYQTNNCDLEEKAD